MIGSLNAFPLFALLLRIKEPSRLPGERGCLELAQDCRRLIDLPAGVEFELQQTPVSRISTPNGIHAVYHVHELKVSYMRLHAAETSLIIPERPARRELDISGKMTNISLMICLLESCLAAFRPRKRAI